MFFRLAISPNLTKLNDITEEIISVRRRDLQMKRLWHTTRAGKIYLVGTRARLAARENGVRELNYAESGTLEPELLQPSGQKKFASTTKAHSHGLLC